MPRILKFATIAIFLVASGCAKAPSRIAETDGGARTSKAASLEAALSGYSAKTQTIKALAVIFISDGEEERRTEAAILIERPHSARVDAMDALADVWAKAGSDGSRLWLYLPARDKLYSGRASKGNIRRLINFEWDIPEIVAAIAGSPPTGGDLEILQVGASRDNHFVVRGRALNIWTDPKSNLPVKCARYEADGNSLDYVVSFGDYRRVGKVDFPHKIDASFPARGARIVLEYRDVSFGGAVDPGLFLAPTRVRGKRVDLKD